MVHRTIIYRPLGYGERSGPAADEDEALQRFVLALVLLLLAFVVALVVTLAVASSFRSRPATGAPHAAPAPRHSPSAALP